METKNFETYCGRDLIALLLKSGFNWQDYFVAHFIDENFHWEIPLHIAQKWLRDVKNIVVYVCPTYEPMRFAAPNVVADDEKWLMKWQVAAIHYNIESDEIDLGDVGDEIFDTYEKALESGEKKVLEIILSKN